MEEDAHCIYCGIEVKEYNTPPHQKIPLNQATIDHIYEKYDKRRYEVFGLHNKVLACWKCNFDRGNEKYKNLPVELRKQRQILSMSRKKGERRDVKFYNLAKSYES
jgi:hypothetical protein